MNTKKEKIIKMSKVLNVFLKIGAIISVMAAVAAMVIAIIAPSLDLTSFSYGGIWLNTQFNGGVNEFRAILIPEIINGLFMASILFVASSIFKDMSRENTPFTQKNANRLKLISSFLVALGILIQPLRALLTIVFVSPHSDIFFSVNLGYLVFAAMFFCLALIFEYGAELQRESDETL